ncbi:MAG: hypothetical protein RIS48_1549 [Pseudomonadota bacterium]|jgi:hypothetical protein|uniref:hypothetical protein n=1 Tax=Malikia spinosa TaxID=86180 RepID=UPI0032354C1A
MHILSQLSEQLHRWYEALSRRLYVEVATGSHADGRHHLGDTTASSVSYGSWPESAQHH